MPDYLFTTSTFLSVIFSLIPLGFHIQLGNSSAILMTMWIAMTNSILFVNSILWANDLNDKAPFWCYVTPPIYVAGNWGLLASITCMIYNLYSYIQHPTIITEVVKRKKVLIEVLFSVIIPFMFTALGYLVFEDKYSIRPILGCFLQSHNDWLYIVLIGIWPVIISGIGCYLAARASYSILMKRLEIHSLLMYCETGLNASKFYRLVLFCVTFLILAFPTSLLTVLSNLINGILPYDFHEVHKYWNTVQRFNTEGDGVSVLDYAKPLTGLFVFLFFGTGRDAVNSYRKFGRSIKLDKIFPCCFWESSKTSPSSTTFTQNSSYPNSPIKNHSNNSNNNGKTFTTTTTTGTRMLNKLSTKNDNDKYHTNKRKNDNKKPMTNLLFLNGHRTPSERANFDLTSGIKFNIEGIDTSTIMSTIMDNNVNDFDYGYYNGENFIKIDNGLDAVNKEKKRINSNVVNVDDDYLDEIVVNEGNCYRNKEVNKNVNNNDLINHNNHSSSTLAVNNNSSYNNTMVAPTPTSFRSHFYENDGDAIISDLSHIDDLLAVYPSDIIISRSPSPLTNNNNNSIVKKDNNDSDYHRESGIDIN